MKSQPAKMCIQGRLESHEVEAGRAELAAANKFGDGVQTCARDLHRLDKPDR